MAQGEDLAQAARRLEAALERIAFATDRLREAPAEPAATAPANTADLSEIAQRLDALIVQLRRTLGGESGPD